MVKYAKLRGKIYEKFIDLASCAEQLPMTTKTLTNKLKGDTEFTVGEVRTLCALLGIDNTEIGEYFFDTND